MDLAFHTSLALQPEIIFYQKVSNGYSLS
jgi:hypothetical protein